MRWRSYLGVSGSAGDLCEVGRLLGNAVGWPSTFAATALKLSWLLQVANLTLRGSR